MIKRGIIFLLFLASVLITFAQDNDIINVRQRLLQRKPQELDEQVDSFSLMHLMIAGNVYQTEKHVNYAYDAETGKYDFTNEFKYVQPLLNLGDISIIDLKTSFGNDSSDLFSSPDEFALTLKYSGINAVMHANMHTANIRKGTLKRTRDVLNQYDMYHTGAYVDQAERIGNYPLIIEKRGFKIAILNYTKLPTRPDPSREFVINEVDKNVIERDMVMARAYKPDFIIVYFDWSDNFQDVPNNAQQELAQYVFEKGASLIVGTCPNTPMRIDHINYYYKKGVTREGIVAYSLGNLVASDEEIKNRNGYIIDMYIRKNRFNKETVIDDWGIVPVYTYFDTTSTPGKTKVFSVPCSAIEGGDIFPDIPYIEKRRVINGAYSVRQMLGSSADELQYNLSERVVNNVRETIQITSASLNNKYSQARASDITPSAAPVTPPPSADPKSSASLEKIYQQSNGPVEALLQPSPEKKKVPVVEGKKDTSAFEREKKSIDEASGNSIRKSKPTTWGSGNNDTKPADVPVGTAKSFAPHDISKDKMPWMQYLPDTVYRVQIFALKDFLPMDTAYYTHLKGYEVYEEGGMIKYVVGNFTTYKDCYDFWKAQMQPRYKKSFIVKFVNGKRALK